MTPAVTTSACGAIGIRTHGVDASAQNYFYEVDRCQNYRSSHCGIVPVFRSSARRPASSRRVIEKAGVGVGVTAGNMWFLPVKAISVTIGALSGALSYVVTGRQC